MLLKILVQILAYPTLLFEHDQNIKNYFQHYCQTQSKHKTEVRMRENLLNFGRLKLQE